MRSGRGPTSLLELCRPVWHGTVVLTSISIILIFLVAGWYEAAKHLALLEKETAAIAAKVSNAVSGDILIGDRAAVARQFARLEKRFDAEISLTAPGDCGKTSWPALFSFRSCISRPVTGGEDHVYVTRTTQHDVLASALRFGLLAALPVLLFGLLAVFLSKRRLEDAIIVPLEELGESPDTWRPRDSGIAAEIIRLSHKVTEFVNERDAQAKLARDKSFEADMGAKAFHLAHDLKTTHSLVLRALNRDQLSEHEKDFAKRAAERVASQIDEALIEFRSYHALGRASSPFRGIESSLTTAACLNVIDNVILEKNSKYRGRALIFRLNPSLSKAPSEQDILWSVDEGGLFRLLSNLIDNAVEALKDGYGAIPVALNQLNENTLELKVTDNGCGIQEQRLARITERAFSYGKEGGSGLGLDYVSSKVAQWGGELMIDSKEGLGTVVTVRLPKVAARYSKMKDKPDQRPSGAAKAPT